MPSTFKNLFLPALLAGVTALSPLAHAESPRNLGWIEHGVIEPADMTVKFKLDTGALTSSMHAEDIERFERDGQQWVRFKVTLEDLKSDRLISETFERPLERDLRVRGAGGSEQRPVVRMDVCVAGERLNEEFSLRDRSNMHYPVLLGRRILDRLGNVDSSRTFTTAPDCTTGNA
ncbi:ATP-dependent zinc protease [Halopseudomonas aestusnigri]|uniref:retropepsin-like aspartic peptidase RloA3 n=1 Tax=Halopseudomonas aestusnigri TaxID=857252 RepID=UPI0028C32774|nr:ATP-dependent zinc protease [Halopseudomonas aestusnigri]